MKRYLRQLFPLLTGLFLTGTIGQGVQAQLLINTVAGHPGVSGTDGDGGPAILAHLFYIGQLAGELTADKRGNYFVKDYTGIGGATLIRKVDARGIITRYAGTEDPTAMIGSGDGGPATAVNLSQMLYMAADSVGDLFILEAGTRISGNPYYAIRRIDAQTGIINTITNSDGAQPFASGTLAKDASFVSARPFTVDAKGNIYVVNTAVSNTIFFKIDAAGMISTYSDLTGRTYEYDFPLDLTYMDDLTIDRWGNLYIVDRNLSFCVYKATPGGVFSKVAGQGFFSGYSGDGGPATDAYLNYPNAVCLDTANNLIISDGFNAVLRKVDAATGFISTIAGNPGAASYGDGGPAIDAQLGGVESIRTNADGNMLAFTNYTVRLLAERLVKFTLDSTPAKTYGDADFVLNATSSNGSVPGFRSSDASVISVTADGHAHIVGAGTVILTADFPAVGTDTADKRSDTLVVAKKGLTVTADDQRISQGDVIPALTIRYGGFVNGDDAGDLSVAPTSTTTATVGALAGNYPITVSGGVSGNYSFTYVPGTLFIAQPVLLSQSIIFGTLADRTYGDADFDAGATSDNATIPVVLRSSNTGVATIVNGQVHIVGAGTTNITASQAADAFYSAAADVVQSLTVNKAVLSVTADDKTVAFGSAVPLLTLSYSGFVNGDGVAVLTTSPQASVTAMAGSPAGDYPISISPGVAANYTLEYHPGVLTIGALAQTITFNALPVKSYVDGDFPAGAVSTNANIPVTYSSSDLSVAAASTDGFIHITGVGTTVITASQAASDNFSAAADVSQLLTVGAAPLVITPDNKTRVQGQANPVFTFNYAGFRKGETPDMLLHLPVASTPANADSYPGVYLITASGAEGVSHYVISYLSGDLTVVVDSTKGIDRLETWCSSPTMLEVNVFAMANQQATIDLFSLGGQRVTSVPVRLLNASNNYHIPVGNVTPGLYIVKVTGQYLKLSQKIRIQ